MSKSNAKVKRVAYFGWRGIVGCEVLELGEGPMTGLLGPSGAGKTTLALCLANALLPDRQVLDIQPISEVRDNQSAGADVLAGKIDPESDYAYVVLDIESRDSSRLLAGIYAVKEDGRARLTRWLVRKASEELNLRDLLAMEDNEGYISYPEFRRLKQVLAARGIDVETCQSIGDYGEALFDAGILPSSMRTRSDRILYANLLKTTFRGGFSSEVAQRLKDYLLSSTTQVPEIVKGLQECADEIFKTRSAISDADRELALLKSTYGEGRDIVARSIRWLNEEKETLEEQKKIEKERLEEETRRSHELVDLIESVEGSLVETRKDKKEAEKSAWDAHSSLNKELEEIRVQHDEVKELLVLARTDKKNFQAGKDIWLRVSKLAAVNTYDDARKWFKNHIGGLRKKESKLDGEIEGLLEKINRIELNRPSEGTESLQNVLGGETLEQEFRDLDEERALAIDLSLSGITDGLVGLDKNDLADIEFSPLFPTNFWIGMTKPKAQAVEKMGDWLFCPAPGGYVVTGKGRSTVFGSQARARLWEEYEDQRNRLQAELSGYKEEIDSLIDDNGLDTSLSRHKKEINFYLKNRDHFELDHRYENLEKESNALSLKIKSKSDEIKEAEKNCREIGKPYENKLLKLSTKKNSAETEFKEATNYLNDAKKRIDEYTERLECIYKEETEVKTVLKDEYPILFEYAYSDSLKELDYDDVLAELAGKIVNLKMTLNDLLPDKASFFDRLQAKDRANTAALWPLLTDLIRERINIDLANSDGIDLIQDAQDRRTELGNELEQHEKIAQVKARSIANTIRSSINSAKLRIRKLSRLGHDIQFGNITGVQLRLLEKSPLLNLLDNFTGQLALFSANKSIDEAIKEWFDKGLGEEKARHLSGKELLDYRNYVTFAVEAKRKSGEWEPVSPNSLSGGESIGCGLALALMLMRSITGRGDVKSEVITPLFMIDEVHRLDDAGVAVIVNLARRENFQVLVTAQKIEPSYNCTLYNLSRIPSPDRLIIRGIKVKNQKEY